MVTLAVIAVLTGIALPALNLPGQRMRAATRELMTTLAAAQNRAVMNQHDVVVAFDTVAGTVRVHLDADNDGLVDGGESVSLVALSDGVHFARGAASPRALGPKAVSATHEQDDLPALTFHRNGSVSEMALLYLAPGTGATTDPHADRVRAVEVERATGRATCFRFTGSAWEAGC